MKDMKTRHEGEKETNGCIAGCTKKNGLYEAMSKRLRRKLEVGHAAGILAYAGLSAPKSCALPLDLPSLTLLPASQRVRAQSTLSYTLSCKSSCEVGDLDCTRRICGPYCGQLSRYNTAFSANVRFFCFCFIGTKLTEQVKKRMN